MTKFCTDCKHAEGDPADPYSLRCGHPDNSVKHVDMARYAVSGIEQPAIDATLAVNCLTMRQYERHPMLGITLCGPDGVWFEAKNG